MALKVIPLADRLLVRRSEKEERTKEGIIIPGNAKEQPITGEVLAVGRGKLLDNGQVRELSLKAGDKILFGRYAGTEVKVSGEELLVMREDDVIGIIEE